MEMTIKEYIPYINKKQKDKDMYSAPTLNWTWSISSKGKTITYGYTHTQEKAIDIATYELKNRSRLLCNS